MEKNLGEYLFKELLTTNANHRSKLVKGFVTEDEREK